MNPPIHILGAIIGGLTLAAAVMVVTARVPVHAACFLILTLFGVAAEYVVLEAHTVAVFQVLVYAGAVVVLIAFVLMLMGSGPKDEEPVFLDNWRSIVGLTMSVALLALFGYALSIDRPDPVEAINYLRPERMPQMSEAVVEAQNYGSLESLGDALLSGYVFPFEVISLLLMVAIVGAVALLRKPPVDEGEEAEQ